MDTHTLRLFAVVLLSVVGRSSGQVLPPGPFTGEVGGNITFRTTISSTSPEFLTITWTFIPVNGSGPVSVIGSGPGGSTAGSGYKDRVSVNRVTGSLELKQLTLRDSGGYTVALTLNTGAQQTGETTLKVYEKISGASITGPTEVLIAGNRSANLSCQTTAGTIISRKWLKDGRPLSHSNRITFSGDNSSVSIDPLLGTDNGKYQCILTNPVSTDYARYYLTVNYGPEDVVIQGRSEIEIGYTVVLTCSASSVPPATFTWTFNGTETTVITEEYTVENATFRESGTYTCVAKNSVTGYNISSAPHVVTVKESNSGSQLGIIFGGIFGTVACVTVAGGAFACMKNRKRRDRPVNQDLQTVVYENTKDLSPPVHGNLPMGSTDLSGPVDAENRCDYEELRFKDTATYSTINSL